MRKVIEKIICDRCGMEITGDPVRITPHYVKRKPDEQEELEEGRNEIPVWMERMMNKEFCTECAKNLVDLFWRQKGNR